MTDEELYRRYLDGDEKSVDELMKRHESGLILYITGYLHDVRRDRHIHDPGHRRQQRQTQKAMTAVYKKTCDPGWRIESLSL